MRFAVLDLGSNTFHLLIVESNEEGGFTDIYRERHYVKLSQGGIEVISKKSYDRAIVTLSHFRKMLDLYKVSSYKALGTSSLRSAINGKQLVDEVYMRFKIGIDIISGKKEASYISKGVMSAVILNDKPHLIIDIGGGSVEFILIIKNQVVWFESFNIGLGILKNRFHFEEPMSSLQIGRILHFFESELTSLKNCLAHHPNIECLIGASGSFEVIQAILQLDKKAPAFYACDIDSFDTIKSSLVAMDKTQRLQHPSIPNERADLIVVALLLIDYILKLSGAKKILISEYALKEGVLIEMKR